MISINYIVYFNYAKSFQSVMHNQPIFENTMGKSTIFYENIGSFSNHPSGKKR